MKLRKLMAALLLAALPLGLVAVAEAPALTHTGADYSITVFQYGPGWAQWTFMVGAVVTCVAFTGPAAAACAIAAGA